MVVEQQALIEYLAARRAGRKYISENAGKNGKTGYLEVLEEKLQHTETVGEINLGSHEIPLKKIVGTFTTARSTAFAGNFMPILGEGTEFSFKWQSLYIHHIDTGISDPIKVYEYLNLFYVLEGNKRVSVLNHVGAYSIRADVIRLVPKRDQNNPEIEIYYEMLDYNPKIFAFNDMWFSRKGSFAGLINMAEKFSAGVPEIAQKKPHEWLTQVYKDFSRQYSAAGFGSIGITTGDAFIEFIKIYGIPYNVPYDEIGVKVRNCEAQFRLSAGLVAPKLIEDSSVAAPQTRGLFSKITARKARAVFVYTLPPEESSRTRAHEQGRLAAEKFFDGLIKTEAIYGVSEHDAHERLLSIAKTKPDLIFTVNSVFGHASLQTSLEAPESIVFNLNHTQPGARLNTYYCKLYEMTFMFGVIAGATTKTGVIGFINPLERGLGLTYGINSFALGAKLVNHNVRVKAGVMNSVYSKADERTLFEKLAAQGADMICSQFPEEDPFWAGKVDNFYGMLNMVDPNGAVLEYLATSSWNWEVVYTKILGDYLDGTFDLLKRPDSGSLHFWLGLAAAATDIYMSNIVLGTHTARLGGIFRNLIADSMFHPFLGPIKDVAGEVRVEKGDIPSLIDVQTMRWLSDIVGEIIFPQ